MADNFDNLTDEELDNLVINKVHQPKNDFNSLSDEELDNALLDRLMTDQENLQQNDSDIPTALLEGFGEGLSFGHLPQMQSKLEPITDRLFNLLPGDDVEPAPWSQLYSNDENYRAARDNNRKRLEEIARRNPKSYYGSQVAGALALGGAAVPAKAVQGAAKLKQASLMGGAYGAISNPGDVEGVVDSLQLAPRVRNAAIGAITALGFQKGIDLIAKHSKPLAVNIAKAAEKRAARALGAERATAKKLGEKKIREIGRYALDEEIVNPALFRQTEKMAIKNKASMKKGADLMEDAYSSIDDHGASTFNPLDVATEVDDKVGDFWLRSPLNRGESKQFENTLDAILMRGDKNIPLKEAQKLKEELGKVAKWKNNIDLKDKEIMAREAYDVVKEAIDKAAKEGAESIGIMGVTEKLKKGKSLYSAGKGAEDLLTNKVAREQGNQMIGLTDGVWGGASLATFGPKGLAIIGAKKILDKYGAAHTAKVLDKISKGVSKTSSLSELSKKNPAAFQALVFKLTVNTERKLQGDAFKSLRFADKDIKELKGREKWIGDGMLKLSKHHKAVDFSDAETIKRLLMDKKGEQLLIEISGKKPNSRGMSSVIKKIDNHLKEGKK